jgi:DNA polymerase-1
MHLLIDGKNLVYRAFHGMPELTRSSDGFPTGAIYGWLKTLWKLADEYPAATMEVFWDAGFAARTDLSSEYKVNRKPMPEAMRPQLPIIEKLTTLMGITSFKEPGMEADDLLASRAWTLSDKGGDVLIVSADKDFAQCVGDKINLLRPPPTANPKLPWKRYDRVAVCERFCVCPEQIPDYLAIMGDSSDNVIGIDGVGPKRASDWLKLYKNIDGIIANCGRLAPKSCQQKVYENQELLKMNLQLVTLKRRDLSDAIRIDGKRDANAMAAELETLEMRSTAEEAKRRYGAV